MYMYIDLHGKISGASKNVIFFAIFSKYGCFDKTIHRAFIHFYKTLFKYKQQPLDKVFIFTTYQNYTLDLSIKDG